MRSLIVFNHLNDIVYLNCSPAFVKHVAEQAKAQGLVSSKHSSFYAKGPSPALIDPNILIQLFSPLVTSHRFMKDQFGNPYNSVQTHDGTKIVFQDYMGFLFIRIGRDEVQFLRRALGVAITFVTYVVGPDVALLKTSKYHSELLDSLLETWARLYLTDQAFLIEAVEQMILNIQVSSSLVKSLETAAGKVKSYGAEQVHAILFLETKLLSWYSTRRSYHLTAQDLLFLLTLCQRTWPGRKRGNDRGSSAGLRSDSSVTDEDDDDDSCSSSLGYFDSTESLAEVLEEDAVTDFSVMKHYFILLKSGPSLVPHRVHISLIQEGLFLVLVSEPLTSGLPTVLISSLQLLSEISESRRDVQRDKVYFEALESSLKRVAEWLKRQKGSALRTELGSRWDRLRLGYTLYLRTKDPISLQLGPLTDILREAFRTYFGEREALRGVTEAQLGLIQRRVQNDTLDYWDFLKVKASRNTTLGSKNSLTIDKYLEEFPGLVHFIYVDRNGSWVTMPALDLPRDQGIRLTRKKIWDMVTFAREHIQQGHFSLMWKDSAFNYAYFLWFEDSSGQAIRSKTSPGLPWDGNCLPGILSGDFYRRLVTEVFPAPLASRVRCLELFCIHLGLATSSCVLEHSKRLATTITEVTGAEFSPAS